MAVCWEVQLPWAAAGIVLGCAKQPAAPDTGLCTASGRALRRGQVHRRSPAPRPPASLVCLRAYGDGPAHAASLLERGIRCRQHIQQSGGKTPSPNPSCVLPAAEL